MFFSILVITFFNILILTLTIFLNYVKINVSTDIILPRSAHKQEIVPAWRRMKHYSRVSHPVYNSTVGLLPVHKGILLNIMMPLDTEIIFRRGITEIIKRYPEVLLSNANVEMTRALKVNLVKFSCTDNEGCQNINSVATQFSDNNSIDIFYSSYSGAFRALGRLIVAARNAPFDRGGKYFGIISGFTFKETSWLLEMGVKIDLSSGGVMKLDSIKNTMVSLALYGYNTLFLYMEDSFEVQLEPFVGYLRGRYTGVELVEIGRFAKSLGIEIVPCIQTLSHLDQILKWPAYAGYKDSSGNLKMNGDNSYNLLERMILAVTEPLQSKRIHIGLDSMKGMRDTKICCEDLGASSAIVGVAIRNAFASHLQRLLAVIHSLRLRPVLYTNLLSQLAKIGSCECGSHNIKVVNEELLLNIHELLGDNGKDLMFTEFSSSEVNYFERIINDHEKLKNSGPIRDNSLILSLGLWTWTRFWAALHWTMSTLDAGVDAAQRKGIQSIVVEARATDGNQFAFITAEAGISYFAELVRYSSAKSRRLILQRTDESFSVIFRTISTFSDILEACAIDQIPGVPIGWGTTNIANWFLWEDPFLPYLSYSISEEELIKHYCNLANTLDLKMRVDFKKLHLTYEKENDYVSLHPLAFPAAISRVLHRKALLKMHFKRAYKHSDRNYLSKIISEKQNGIFFELIDSIVSLRHIHKILWSERYKQSGWEILEARYGILRARLEGFMETIHAFIEGEIVELEWNEENINLKVYDVENFRLPIIEWSKAVSASFYASACFDDTVD